ncbi:class I SAM-dependent methyltransferase [Planctomycetota bacterium]|nr:class I SAM-dependent methyltransferase [Planctomycetota bacterium]
MVLAVAPRFEFGSTPVCVCGVDLKDVASTRSREFPWGTLRFARCPACGTWLHSPTLTAKCLAAWYDSPEYQGAGAGPYLDYADSEAGRLAEASARYRRDLAPILQPGARVLEVGCATGSLVKVLGEHGHDVVGIDLSQEFVKQAQVKGLNVEAQDFAAFQAAPASFECIVLLGTFSNLQNLRGHLDHMHELLAPGGLLYFNAPLCDSRTHRAYGARSWMFAPSAQQFCTFEGVRRALALSGFSIERSARDRQMPTVSKLLGLGRLRGLYPLVKRLGVGGTTPPAAVPIPGVRMVWARRLKSAQV